MPWAYALIFCLLHIALLGTRIAKWEKSLYLSLAMAAFTIFFTGLTYGSTKLSAESIYVWLPITLAGEVGAVMQVHSLLYQEYGARILKIKYIRGGHKLITRILDYIPLIRRSPKGKDPQNNRNDQELGAEGEEFLPGTEHPGKWLMTDSLIVQCRRTAPRISSRG